MKKINYLVLCAMLAILIPRLSLALSLDDITDKSSDVYQDLTATGSHFFMLGVLFQQPSKYLCQISQTNYKQFANFMATASATSVPYRADINEEVCASEDRKTLRTVEAKQASKDSPLNVTVWNDERAKSSGTSVIDVEVETETSATNPWGEVTYNVEVASVDAKLLFKNYGKSKKLQDGSVSVQGAFMLETSLIDPSFEIGEERQWFSGDLTHREDDSGEGTIVFKNFNPGLYARFDGTSDASYPNGRPYIIFVADIAYNSESLKYRQTIDFPFFPEAAGDGAGGELESCVSRKVGWEYVEDYGVYDSSGAKNTDAFTATYIDENGDSIGITKYSDDSIETDRPPLCRAWSDGSDIGFNGEGGACLGLGKSNNNRPFPSVELPNFSFITRDSDGAEFLVKHLLKRVVNGVVDDSLCEGLTIPDTRTAPNHLFFSETALTHKPPSSGAVMVSSFPDGSNDRNFVEQAYAPLLDDDGDGVLNYLDAFPVDADKTKDLDGDGIDDSADDSDDRSTYDYSDDHSSDPTEYVSGSMAPVE
ncbi:hypothetical protein N9Q31_06320 [Pseudomonadales bacterium]|nr:hypothetical protein [Pseudomonadales bacterium]